MSGCNGNCEACGGCAGELVLSQVEIDLLNALGENAFLPVARSAGDSTPVYLEEETADRETASLVLQVLEKKGLISLDFDKPLLGADMSRYKAYPIWGSIALTARGQQVLDILDKQGAVQ